MKVRFYFNDYTFFADTEWCSRLPKKEEIIFKDAIITTNDGKTNVYSVDRIPPYVHRYELVQITDSTRTLIEFANIRDIEGFVIENGPFWRNIEGFIYACFLLKTVDVPKIHELM